MIEVIEIYLLRLCSSAIKVLTNHFNVKLSLSNFAKVSNEMRHQSPTPTTITTNNNTGHILTTVTN